jgi:hypothetical protein
VAPPWPYSGRLLCLPLGWGKEGCPSAIQVPGSCSHPSRTAYVRAVLGAEKTVALQGFGSFPSRKTAPSLKCDDIRLERACPGACQPNCPVSDPGGRGSEEFCGGGGSGAGGAEKSAKRACLVVFQEILWTSPVRTEGSSSRVEVQSKLSNYSPGQADLSRPCVIKGAKPMAGRVDGL